MTERGSRLLAVTVVASVLAACGRDGTEERPSADQSRPTAVAVQIEPSGGAGPSGPPDAGVAAGHGADTTVLATGSVATISGTVQPTGSTVKLSGPDGTSTADVSLEGGFRARVTGLRRGANTVRLDATAPGRPPWQRDLRVVRR